jgi:hypothetical protein
MGYNRRRLVGTPELLKPESRFMALVDTEIKSHTYYRDALRGWLSDVQRIGELLHANGANWDVEMGSITQMLTDRSNNIAPAILFDEVPGYPKGFRALYGHLSTVRRVALTLGLPLNTKWQAIVERAGLLGKPQ